MVERLLSYAILLICGLSSLDKYNEYLDGIFLQYPDNDLLLELECCSSDAKTTVATIQKYSAEFENELDYDIFGASLFRELKLAYEEMDIKNFAKIAYLIWGLLPNCIEQVEPFWTLCYADDPLSWGDERQTRELYENMLNYYKGDSAL